MRQSLLHFILLTFSILACKQNQELNALDIIDRAIHAYGGEQKLTTIQSQKETGTSIIYLNDTIYRSSQYLSYEKTGGKSYYESPLNQKRYAKKLVFGNNGSYSWTQNDGAMAPYMQPQEEHRDQGGEDYPYFFTLVERGIEIEYKGSEKSGDETLHRIDYVNEKGQLEEVYFEGKNWFIRKIRKTIETSQGTAENIKYYYDYRYTNGIAVPFRTESHFPPNEIDVYLMNELEINSPMDESIFEFPTAYKFNSNELSYLTGEFRNENGNHSLKISSSDGKLKVDYNGNQVEPLVVDPALFMFRNGEGFGSWMFNVRFEMRLNQALNQIVLHTKDDEVRLTRR